MQFRKPKNAGRRSITTLVVSGLVFLLSAAFASAVCGPEFNSKKEAINYVKNNPAVADGLANWLSTHKRYGYHADQDVIAALEQNTRAFKAPRNYVLKQNTACKRGPGHYEDYDGLYGNMGGELMLWYGNKKGEYFPLLKDYCFNAVFGPPVIKKPPVKPPCKKKCRPPCKKKCKKPKPKSCKAQGKINVNGNCVKQTNTAANDCTATVGGQWVGNQCVNIQVNNVCGNVSVGNEGNVNQGGNCNYGGTETCVGQYNCNTIPPPPPPCTTKCHPEEPEKPTIMITSTTQLNMIPAGKNSGPFKISVEASEAGGTLTVDPGIGAVSSCGNTTPQEKAVFSNLAKGASELCVIIYAPENDADKPEWMTVTETAVLGSAYDKNEQKLKITYPTRPE